jgi:hypothetical protein
MRKYRRRVRAARGEAALIYGKNRLKAPHLSGDNNVR